MRESTFISRGSRSGDILYKYTLNTRIATDEMPRSESPHLAVLSTEEFFFSLYGI